MSRICSSIHPFLVCLLIAGATAASAGGATSQGDVGAASVIGAIAKTSAGSAPPSPKGQAVRASDQTGGGPQPGRDGLDSDLVYSVLVAELAARAGDLELAFNHYLYAAQLSRSPEMAELAVRTALAREDSESIRRGVDLWQELAPDSVGAQQVAALLSIQADDQEGALRHLRSVVRLSGDDRELGYTRAVGIIARAAGNDERVALMQALADADPQSAEARQALAMVAAAADRFDVAEAAAREALELRPDWTRPRIFLVRLLITQDKRDQARSLLERYVAESPEDRALRMLYGQLLVEAKELSGARHEFEHILGRYPKEPDVLFAVGILSLELDDLDSARGYFQRLYETGARRDEAAFYMGQVEERAEHPDQALGWYDKVAAGSGNALDASLRSAVIRAKQGDVGRARETLQQLRGEYPDDAEQLFLAEAEILAELDRKEEALEVYDNALKAFPDNPDLLYARAMYAVRIDRLELAERDLRRIIDEDPNNADALNALGYTLADRTDRYEEARQLIEAAYKLEPDEPAIIDSMGWVQYRLGNYEAALGYLRRALDAMSDGEIAAHLGEALWASGRREEAWRVWESALKEHPDHAYLQEVVARHRVSRTESGK